jgi:hypothetical protein
MTVAEVEAILGGPARNESTGPVEPDGSANVISAVRFDGPAIIEDLDLSSLGDAAWQSDHVSVNVLYDSAGCVVQVGVTPVHRVHESPLDKLRRWLRL